MEKAKIEIERPDKETTNIIITPVKEEITGSKLVEEINNGISLFRRNNYGLHPDYIMCDIDLRGKLFDWYYHKCGDLSKELTIRGVKVIFCIDLGTLFEVVRKLK
jgi:hypothetical protein